MRKALRNLRTGKAGQGADATGSRLDEPMNEAPTPVEDPGPGGWNEIQPTHVYVRFKPADTDQLADLEAAGLQLSFEPLDEGVAAVTSVNYSSADIPWVYTAVPTQTALPGHIQQEKIDDLFLFNEDDGDMQDGDPWEPTPPPTEPCEPEWNESCRCYVICQRERQAPVVKRNTIRETTERLQKAGISPLALYNEAMRISGHEEEMLPEPSALLRGARYYPSGTIRVRETALSTDVPLRGAEVLARRWFKTDGAFLTENGSFRINTGYRDKVKLIVQFKSGLATTRGYTAIMQPWDAVLPIRHMLGDYDKGQMQNMSYTFAYQANAESKGALAWVAATCFNSIVEANAYSDARGLPRPVTGLNIWLSSAVTRDASAPMLRRIAVTTNINAVLDFITPSTVSGAVLRRLMVRQLPDITCRYGSSNSATSLSNELAATFYHELAHSQHYAQVGNNFWTSYIAYIVGNDGYGQKSSSGSGRIAISEAWGNYIQRLFTIDRYQGTSRNNLADIDRDELELQRPADDRPSNWIVYGMLHDMTDVGEPAGTTVIDNVDAFTPPVVFRGLQSNVTTVRAYQTEIFNQNNALQGTQMNQLVMSYRW